MPSTARRARYRITGAAVRFSAFVSVFAVAAIFGFLIYFCLPLFHADALKELLSWDWRPFQGQFGILPMLVGSVLLSLSALVFALPAGLGICCFIHGTGTSRASSIVLFAVRLMTGVPTVVYGFTAVFVLVPLVRQVFHHGSGYSWAAATIGLAVLILPTIVLMIHSQFQEIEPRIRPAASALGMTRTQQLVHLVIPLSRKGILSAVILGFGRAVGDTMIPLMLAGNAPQVPESVFDSIRTLTAHIALVVAADSSSTAYLSLFAAGLILFLTTGAVTICLRLIRSESEEGA